MLDALEINIGKQIEMVWIFPEGDSAYVGKRMLKLKLPETRLKGRLKWRFVEEGGYVGKEDAEDRVRWKKMICHGD